MTELLTPRLAGPDDRDSLFGMCSLLWEENGIFPMSEPKVRRVIEIAVNPKSRQESEPLTIISVIGAVGAIEASLAICITQNWYTDAWHIEELWNFVLPEKRKSNYAKYMLEFAKTIQAQMQLPLLIGVLSADRTYQKVRLYSRQYGAPSGAYFVWPSWNALRNEKKQMQEIKALFDNGRAGR